MRRDESGATLVELLAAILIFGIIGGVLTDAIVIGLRSTAETEKAVSESVDRQFVSRWFGRDVQSADTVRRNPETACGGEPVAPDIEVITFAWEDGDVPKVSSYLYEASRGRLVRKYCEGQGAEAAGAETTLASALAATDPVLVECNPDPDPAPQPCPDGEAPPTPNLVAMRVTDQSGGSFQLQAYRRATG
jgi:hypothetical protein